MQLHKLLIQKQLAALLAPISWNLEEEKAMTSPGIEPMTFHTKPSRSTEWAIRNDEHKCGKWCTNANFTLNLQLLGAASNRCSICIWKRHFYFSTNYLQRLQPKVAETNSCSYCNYQLHYSCTLVAKICSDTVLSGLQNFLWHQWTLLVKTNPYVPLSTLLKKLVTD